MTNRSTIGEDYKFSVCMLASGSKGNAIYISDGFTSILIDAGLSGIEIERRLRSRGLHPEHLDAIIVSHEHHDHIRSVGVLARRYDLPVYINCKTSKAASLHIKSIQNEISFECGANFMVNALEIHPFSISHDAEDPAGFTVSRNNTKIGIATDLGIATSMVKENLKNCSLLILEANHDPAMLANGHYPWPLKQRIKSRTGHLSNADSKRLLNELQHKGLEYVILAHLSESNNTPRHAISTVGQALADSGAELLVAEQNICGDLLCIK